jgi:hypothetical protein
MILLAWLVVVNYLAKVIFMEDKTLLSVFNLTLTLVQDYSVQVLSLLLLKMKKVVAVYLMTNLQLRQQNLLWLDLTLSVLLLNKTMCLLLVVVDFLEISNQVVTLWVAVLMITVQVEIFVRLVVLEQQELNLETN